MKKQHVYYVVERCIEQGDVPESVIEAEGDCLNGRVVARLDDRITSHKRALKLWRTDLNGTLEKIPDFAILPDAEEVVPFEDGTGVTITTASIPAQIWEARIIPSFLAEDEKGRMVDLDDSAPDDSTDGD